MTACKCSITLFPPFRQFVSIRIVVSFPAPHLFVQVQVARRVPWGCEPDVPQLWDFQRGRQPGWQIWTQHASLLWSTMVRAHRLILPKRRRTVQTKLQQSNPVMTDQGIFSAGLDAFVCNCAMAVKCSVFRSICDQVCFPSINNMLF